MARKDFGAKPYTYPQPVFILATYNEDGRTYTGFLWDYVPRLLLLGTYVDFVSNYVP